MLFLQLNSLLGGVASPFFGVFASASKMFTLLLRVVFVFVVIYTFKLRFVTVIR